MPASLRSLAALLLLAFAVPALAQEVKLPAEIRGDTGTFIEVKATTTDSLVKWKSVDAGLMLFPAHLLKDSKVAVVLAMKDGRYRLLAVSAKDGTPSDFAECVVTIGTPLPVPVPPGPGPEPPPNPPIPPQPTIGPLRVLMLQEEDDRNSSVYSRGQIESMTATAVLKYLMAHTKDASGQTSYQIWDDDYVDASLVRSGYGDWLNIYAKAKLDSKANSADAKQPWLLIEQKDADGKHFTVHSGQLTTLAETLITLKKFGGE